MEFAKETLQQSGITPNKIGNMITVSRAPSDKEHTRTIRKQLKQLKSAVDESLQKVEPDKSTGFNGIYLDFLINK